VLKFVNEKGVGTMIVAYLILAGEILQIQLCTYRAMSKETSASNLS